MKWPYELLKIILFYYRIQCINKKLSPEQKNQMAKKLIYAYNRLPKVNKKDILVPADGNFMKNKAIVETYGYNHKKQYEIAYEFPEKNGFLGIPTTKDLNAGEVFDRIGAASGRYLSPIINGKPQNALQRALPYYLPEKDISKNPSYHRYKVSRNVYLPEFKNSKYRKTKVGKVSPAFFPFDGGGVQVLLVTSVKNLKRIIYEI